MSAGYRVSCKNGNPGLYVADDHGWCYGTRSSFIRPDELGDLTFRWSEEIDVEPIMVAILLPQNWTLAAVDPPISAAKTWQGRIAAYWMLNRSSGRNAEVEWRLSEMSTTLDGAVAALNRTRSSIASNIGSILVDRAYKYDVALSFAGEDRAYVIEVAQHLRGLQMEVIFDEFEDLWGKRLIEYLGEVYQERSRFVVLFISEHYVRKAWPKHERHSALAGDFLENKTRVLPVRFDDTKVPGLPPDIGYIDLRTVPPAKLADLIRRKVVSVE
jgi:hypothetical protein